MDPEAQRVGRRRRWLGRVQRPRREDPASPIPDELPEPNEREKGVVPVVPFLPVRCPRCGELKPITVGRHPQGKRRYHVCSACGLKFMSHEIQA